MGAEGAILRTPMMHPRINENTAEITNMITVFVNPRTNRSRLSKRTCMELSDLCAGAETGERAVNGPLPSAREVTS
jgi:hypothetical protein